MYELGGTMLRVLVTTDAELSQSDVQFLEQLVVKSGAASVATFAGHPPSEAELFEYNPEVIIAGGSPIGPVWAFLLRLKSFRLQGKTWPKVIVSAEPAKGRYIRQTNQYEEKELDYFYDSPPYQELYDIALENIIDGEYMAISFLALEVEHLAYTTGAKKQWRLADGFRDYGQLSFKSLEPVHLGPPTIVCDFQPSAAFAELQPLFDTMLALWPQRRDKRTEWARACSAIRRLQLQLIPMDESMKIDKILADPNKFSISIEQGEADVSVAHIFLS
jgi:hypothetical protein